jgi:hypothetical protein
MKKNHVRIGLQIISAEYGPYISLFGEKAHSGNRYTTIWEVVEERQVVDRAKNEIAPECS